MKHTSPTNSVFSTRIILDEKGVNGKLVAFKGIEIDNLRIIVNGKYIRMAVVRDEWDQDVKDPETVTECLKKSGLRIDVFTFIQRLPESRPKYKYHMEWESLAAIPIVSYEHWFKNQIPDQTRNKIKKAAKLGVEVNQIAFGDEVVRGISSIYNETRIRQGTKNVHYNMPYEMVKKLNETFLDRSDFIAAFYNKELIGYLKIVYTDKYARVMGILGKVRHKDKSPMNLLIAKAVQICAEKKVPYFIYANYDYGKVGSDTLKEFKKNNGFENIVVPRYFIPLNNYGHLILKSKLYRGIKNIIPRPVVRKLLDIRRAWYERAYSSLDGI